jgi:signal transduction histidine kinase
METQGDRGASWRELHEAAHELIPAAATTADEMRKLPIGGEVAEQMLDIVSRLDRLITGGEQADREGRLHELQNLLDLKSGFLRLAVHELRRPLGLIAGYLSLLQDPAAGPIPKFHGAQIIKQVRTSVEEMRRLVSDLEGAARLEDGTLALRRCPCSLDRLAKEAIRSVQLEARAKDIALYRKLSQSGSPAIISADPNRLRTAIINLLSNAIKFSPQHTEVVVVPRVEAGVATISVRDHGPGIDPAKAKDLFRAWHRGQDVKADGLGLGLYIVRQIADLHGGEVLVESSPGQGAEFTIRLPK